MNCGNRWSVNHFCYRNLHSKENMSRNKNNGFDIKLYSLLKEKCKKNKKQYKKKIGRRRKCWTHA